MSCRIVVCCALALVACGDPEVVDAGPGDAGADAGLVDAAVALPDAGQLPDPSGEMALDWSLVVTSAQRLGGVAESRLAPSPGGVVLSVSLGGASATFADGTPESTTVGDDVDNSVTQALGWISDDGVLSAARAVAQADPVMDNYRGLGWDVETLPDGTAFVAGRFEGGARFGGADPLAETFQTLRVIMDPDIPITSGDAYLSRFDPSHAIEWTQRGQSESPVASLRFVDIEVLDDGGTIGIGIFDDPITLGTASSAERLALSAGAERETFIARFDPTGALLWTRALRGTSEPRRLAAYPDGSFIALIRYADTLVLGAGEPAETTLTAPPDGTLFWDAVARFDAAGQLVWAVRFGSDATTYPGLESLRLDGDGVVLGGTFRGEIAWPEQPSVDPTVLYGAEALLTRLDAAGVVQWQTHVRPVRDIQLQALAPAPDGGTWVLAGVSRDGATFGPAGAPPLELPGDATLDSRLVLLRFDDAGEMAAAQLLGEVEIDADDLLVTAAGELIMAGRFGEGTVLEPGTSAARALPSAASFRNVFVARYRPR